MSIVNLGIIPGSPPLGRGKDELGQSNQRGNREICAQRRLSKPPKPNRHALAKTFPLEEFQAVRVGRGGGCSFFPVIVRLFEHFY